MKIDTSPRSASKRKASDSPVDLERSSKRVDEDIAKTNEFFWPQSLWPDRLAGDVPPPDWLTPKRTTVGSDSFIRSWDQARWVERNEQNACLLRYIWPLFELESRDKKIGTFFKEVFRSRYKGKSSIQSLPLLHIVAMSDLRLSAQHLMDQGEDVNQCDEQGLTALHRCAEAAEDIETIELLLENGAEASYRDQYGLTALHRAAFRGHRSTVSMLLSRDDRRINVQDCSGRSALHCAILGRAHGFWPKESWEPLLNGETSLPSHKGRTNFEKSFFKDTVRALLDHHARTDLQDTNGQTALHLAVIRHQHEIVETLLRHNGEGANIKDHQGVTPLRAALEIGDHETIIRIYANAKIDYWKNTFEDRNVLSLLAAIPPLKSSEHGPWNDRLLKWAKELVTVHGLDVDDLDSDERRPLSHAASAGNIPLVRLLLDEGACAYEVDTKGRNALSYLAGANIGWMDSADDDRDEQAKAVCRQILEHSEKDVHKTDENGFTPLAYARMAGSPMESLLESYVRG